MTLQELKTNITTNALLDDLLVLVCAAEPKGKPSRSKKINYGAHFLANQYIHEICTAKGRDIKYVDTLEETLPTSIDLIMGDSNYLYVINVDTFSELQKDYSKFENVVVLCDKLDKKVADRLGIFTVYIPEPEEWATKIFLSQYCPGVSPDLMEWLYKVTDGNIYRMISELDKAKLFEPDERNGVLMALRDEPNSDLYSNSVYNFVDAIFLGDRAKIRDVREHLDCIDVDPVGLTTLLLSRYKGILLATSTNLTADELGMTPKQLSYLKYQYRGINTTIFRDKIKFLSNIDLRLKQCKLEMPKDMFIDYVLAQILV